MADKLVFISNAARWAFVASGVDKSPMTDQAAQRIIDVDFQSEKLVLTYGRHDGRVRAEHESPQLKMVAGLSPALRWRLVVDFQDTYPGKDVFNPTGCVQVFNGRLQGLPPRSRRSR